MNVSEQSAIPDSAKQFRSLLEIVPDMIYKISPDGKFVYINKVLPRLGFSVEELLGEHFSVIIHPDEVDRVSRDSVLPKLKGKIVKKAPKLVDERRTGDRMTKELVVTLSPKSLVRGRSGPMLGLVSSFGEVSATGDYDRGQGPGETRFRGTVGIIKDITDRKNHEAERRKLEEQFRQSQKMEAIGRLAGGVAHDMNNILGAIMGAADLLESETSTDDDRMKDILNILAACRRGRDLTRNLIGFARKGKYVKENICINDLANEVKALLGRTISKRISTQTDLDPHLMTIEGDREQLLHALMNICINGVDAMDERGTLTLRTRNVTLDAPLTLSAETLAPGKYVEIRISDTGLGIEEQIMGNIFEPFFSTKSKDKGSGLGLPMVYGVVKNHGGAVRVRSEINQGTEVFLYLPGNPICGRDSAVLSNNQIKGRSEVPTILVVDDESIILRSIKRLLEKLGYSVLLAENGNQAIDMYREHQDTISLVILDLIMPGMGGYEAFGKLRNIDANVRVLLSSGYSADEKVGKLLENAGTGFISKPYDMTGLAEEVKKALA